MKKIFLIAGEPSGDALGAALMRGLKARGDVVFTGIGGPLMEAEGLRSLIEMEDLCVMGLWDVLGQLPRLLKLIRGVVEEIEKSDPDIVVTIDLPDFNFRVLQMLKTRGKTKAKRIHYVAPSVWAWRPGRAAHVAKFLDGLMCLFPFEPPYFTKHKLRAEYVGHPVVDSFRTGDVAAFRSKQQIPEGARTLGLLFGSRESEVKSMSGVLIDTVDLLRERYKNLHLIIPTLKSVEYQVFKLTEKINCPHSIVIADDVNKWNAFAACDAAIAVSGTVGLELAYAGVPHAITYKMHPVTWGIVKALAKTKYAHLGNVLLNEPAFPEFLQGNADPLKIAREIMRIYDVPENAALQKEKSEKLGAAMALPAGESPITKAAGFVFDF
jgi:lipid-A-disaccharide synthase